jgi:hypothetical protein
MKLIKGRKTPLKNTIVISDNMGVMNVETAINDILKWCTWSKTYNNMWEKIICEMLIKRGSDEYTN